MPGPLALAGVTLTLAAIGFPFYVATHPQHFGAARITSPLSGGVRALPGPGNGRFGSLAPLIDRRPARPAETELSAAGSTERAAIADRPAPPLPSARRGAPAEPAFRRYDVRATAGALALIDDGDGLHVMRRGDRLPDGTIMLGTRRDRLSLVTSDRPAQGRRERLVREGDDDADRTE